MSDPSAFARKDDRKPVVPIHSRVCDTPCQGAKQLPSHALESWHFLKDGLTQYDVRSGNRPTTHRAELRSELPLMASILESRGRVAALSRSRAADDPDLVAAKRDLAAEKLAAYVDSVVASAPPLTAAQRDRIAALLRGGTE